ncbi:hypothetical protein MROS_2545 [Melioribacter roseus P3M-2]|jgi:uncharacterized protein Smg (DUF494 family)|uniref:DUF494 family protein n=1 Tax=Melioribacter roseus (strain DSM 23840 / JCM 17771 / VKM B-2668 / P3M-2) TaxID=1191523 RepID=I6Z9F8_MELRP|nr:DUF494 family protein [Melioribacter roseus]AFN75775.1 hypothetical protein MROS_2545 [Melioribacter roseus P3M-2]
MDNMKPKVIEIISKILDGLGKGKSLEELNKYFSQKKKYDKQTLSIAFSLIYDKIILQNSFQMLEEKAGIHKSRKSFRFLTEEEKDVLGVENYNYLMHLINVGLINPTTLEDILEQISMFPENKVSRNELNWIVLLSLVDFESDVPPGSRILLYTSDSVN